MQSGNLAPSESVPQIVQFHVEAYFSLGSVTIGNVVVLTDGI